MSLMIEAKMHLSRPQPLRHCKVHRLLDCLNRAACEQLQSRLMLHMQGLHDHAGRDLLPELAEVDALCAAGKDKMVHGQKTFVRFCP